MKKLILLVSLVCGFLSCSKKEIEVPVQSPKIIAQPTNVSVDIGGSFTLSVVAEGENLKYQWKKDGTALAGATGANYTKANAAEADAGVYTCTVTNEGGSVTSASTTVTVNVPLPPLVTGFIWGSKTIAFAGETDREWRVWSKITTSVCEVVMTNVDTKEIISLSWSGGVTIGTKTNALFQGESVVLNISENRDGKFKAESGDNEVTLVQFIAP
jgi:hypothetical protein